MIWVGVAVILALVVVFVWAKLATPKSTLIAAPSPVIAADFAAKKRSEANRIDNEDPNALLRDLNHRD